MRNTLTYNNQTFEGAAIKSAQMAVDTSLSERELDVDTMQATVKSSAALTPYQQNVPVRFLRGGSQYALRYLDKVTRVAPELYALSMISSLGRLSQMEHRGGVYNGVAASTVIASIMGSLPYYVAPVYRDTLLYGWLPYVAPSGENGAQTGSTKDNLMQVLFALNATVRDDADGTLRIENLSTGVSSTLGADRIYRDGASVVTEPTITAVTVLEHQYIAGSETKTLFEGATTAGQIIVFSEPMSDLTATGFSLTESGANYAVVSAGTGTLTGRTYVHTTREITKPVAAANVPNVARIEDATLVSITNSADVVDRLVDYYSHRTWIKVDATINYEDAGDVVDIYDPFDKLLRQACIEEISPLIVSQTMKGSISALVGFTPWQTVAFEDVREVLTGSGTWKAPEGVTQVTAVLIDKGLDGAAGEDGEAGTQNGFSGRINRYSYSISGSAGTPGKGGAGGEGGEGGRILRVEITLSAGDSLDYNVGDETTFGTYSSASGSRSDAGYTDPVTGETYALPGADGTAGASGGRGGSSGSSQAATTAGEAGGDVPPKTGGAGAAGYYAKITGSSENDEESIGGAGGGGASANGNGGAASSTYTTGAGASGIRPAAKTVYGCGGDGGNGGGGSGAGGSWRRTISRTYVNPSYIDYTYNPYTIGPPGSGAPGGLGMSGCIIVYYRRPVSS